MLKYHNIILGLRKYWVPKYALKGEFSTLSQLDYVLILFV
jgi:hypothetical protein